VWVRCGVHAVVVVAAAVVIVVAVVTAVTVVAVAVETAVIVVVVAIVVIVPIKYLSAIMVTLVWCWSDRTDKNESVPASGGASTSGAQTSHRPSSTSQVRWLCCAAGWKGSCLP
jgi:hypothetical protein